jgi:hypothetical protein
MSYPLPKNPEVAKYLNIVRQRNKQMASRCHYCGKKTIGINCEAHRILFVCQDHYVPDNPNVVHRVYAEGMTVPENMMDPNIGGWLSKK